MCGRFKRSGPVREVAKIFGLPEPPPELAPRYNVAPTQPVAVIGLKPDGVTRGLTMLRWGLVREERHLTGKPITNARSESVEWKPTFGDLIESRRCLVVADGFYEWRQNRPGEDPHLFQLKSREPFAFAGLWDVWHPPKGKPVASCCFLTTTPNAVMDFLHDRMPVILHRTELDLWLDPNAGAGDVLPLLAPYPAEEMEAIALTKKINSSKHDGPECIEPVAA